MLGEGGTGKGGGSQKRGRVSDLFLAAKTLVLEWNVKTPQSTGTQAHRMLGGCRATATEYVFEQRAVEKRGVR